MRATAAAAAVATVERSTAHIVDSRSVVGRATTFVVNIDMQILCRAHIHAYRQYCAFPAQILCRAQVHAYRQYCAFPTQPGVRFVSTFV